MVTAAKLSTAQLERIAQAVLSSSLTEISNASTPAEQAKDLIAHAVQYGLAREVAAELLVVGAGRAAMQNLLLGDEHMEQGKQQQDGSMYVMLRIEGKLDNISLRLDNFEQRMRTIEATQANRPAPVSNSDRFLFIVFALILAILFAYNIWGRVL